MRFTIVITLFLSLFFLATDSPCADPPQAFDEDNLSGWDEEINGPLPRWREGGTPPEDYIKPFYPYAVQLRKSPDPLLPPPSGIIESPAEYSPCDGVIFRFSTTAWPQQVVDCVAALTGDPTKDEKAYVVVSNTTQQNAATAQFTAAGADMTKVVFFIHPTDSIWLRDYGPHFIFQDGAKAIVDSHYYPTRPKDNFVPTLLAEDSFIIPSYPMGLYYSGGNFQPGPDRSGYISSLVYQDNPGFSQTYIEQLYNTYQGIDTLHIFTRLPGSVDATGHIDMWMYLVDEDTVIISEFKEGSNPTAIQITNDATTYMQGLGFEVYRTPAWNAGGVHYTYTNAFRVNDRILISTFGEGDPSYQDEDRDALLAWEAAAGTSVEIIQIECYSIIWAAGAIHCIVMQAPRYTEAIPSAHVNSPDGGELIKGGTNHDLWWLASDDVEVTHIDLLYSLDGGMTFPFTIATGETNDGHFDWELPEVVSTEAMVKVVAHDGDANSDEDVCESVFEITDLPQTTYDFSTGAGVDKWCWGYQTVSWSSVNGNRYPVTSEIINDDYNRIAASDATGGDNDANRYRSPLPATGQESTHVIEFTLDQYPETIFDIGILWEGYADDCTQIELYVWDNVEGNWSDGAGTAGNNMYMDNFAGNRDKNLVGHIRDNFERYVDEDKKLTILLYAERARDKSFHDYVAVTVTHLYYQKNLGYGGPGESELNIFGEPLASGNTADLLYTKAPASTLAYMFMGISFNPTPFSGGMLVPFPFDYFAPFYTDSNGELFIPNINGGGGPATVYMQIVCQDSSLPQFWGFSNALEIEVLP